MVSATCSDDRRGRSAGSAPLPAVAGVRDAAAAVQLARVGYVRCGPFLTDDEVAEARSAFTDAMERTGRSVGDRWFPTILLPESHVRDEISSRLDSVIAPKLPRIFDPNVIELMQLHLSVKPASDSSELGPHQDFSVVDERRFTSLYIWIPLEDMDRRNGTLHVVPGSHRFAASVRSQHVPSVFDDVMEEVHRSAVRLDCVAGELIVMVSGVIHFSPPNGGEHTRLAAHGILKPVVAPMVFYFADDSTPEGKVEAYEMDMRSYVEQVHLGRPDEVGVPVDLVDRPEPMTPERFAAGLDATRDARG